MKEYKGNIYNSGVVIVQEKYQLKHIFKHSPDGFGWGYGGLGPADLALSILTDLVGKEEAEKYYQDFKLEFIAKLNGSWTIYEKDIREWLIKKREQNDDTK